MRLSPTSPARRRGTILIVVLALLALFAVIGLSFVLYSGSEATQSRIYREAQDIATAQPNPDAELAAIAALGDIIYDRRDDEAASQFNSIRGHGIARDMYGWFYTGQGNTLSAASPATGPYNVVPYAGVGDFNEQMTYQGGNLQRRLLQNYAYFAATQRYPTPERTGSARANSFQPVTGEYIGKNANYTYPDAKTLFLGLANPLNGQVLVPSYFRPWIFAQNLNNQNAQPTPAQIATALNPTNPNWTSHLGRHLILRPRPIDQNNGNQFPMPPANADGSFTGDVQNLPGSLYPFAGRPGVLIPKNDSIWVDFGAPVQYWNGRKYKPLFATLVLPLNNRVNVSASGNIDRFEAAANAQTAGHISNQGWGPWEINPKWVLNDSKRDPRANSEYQRLIMDRYGNDQPAVSPTTALNTANPTALNTTAIGSVKAPPGTTMLTRSFGTATSPDYAPVDWDASGPVGAIRMMLPGTFNDKPFATTPRWNDPTNLNLARYGNGDPSSLPADVGERDFHPSLFNPYFVGTAKNTLTGRTLGAVDLAKLDLKFGDDFGLSTTSELGVIAPYSFGTSSTAIVNPAFPRTAFPVGRTPANANRMNATTISNSLAVPVLMPSYGGDGLKEYMGYLFEPATGKPYPARAANSRPLTPGTPGPDVSTPTQTTPVQLRALMSHLQGAVDLNRPLTEYRKLTATPLSPLNINNPLVGGEDALYQQAWSDRQLLARDIFNRLVVATGASAAIDPAGSGYMFPTVIPGSPEYDALRYLAQLAVNIVDFIDADDIGTAFVWNPTPGSPFHNAANFDPVPTNAGFIGNRVVFGVEKPKLVPNEVYSELANNPADSSYMVRAMPPPSIQPNQLRFWVELVNPGTNELVPGKTNTKPLPAINTNTRLYYAAGDPVDAGTMPYNLSPFQVHVYLNGGQVVTDLNTPSNVTGGVSPTATQRIKYDFATTPLAMRTLAPNGGQYGNPAAAGQSPGFVLLGPDLAAMGTPSPVEFNPAATIPGAAGAMIPVPPDAAMGGMNQMHYAYPASMREAEVTTELTALNSPATGRPAVVLRRLMNPYLPPNDPIDPANNLNSPTGAFDPTKPVNPYLTVDVAGQNVVQDAVRIGSDSRTGSDRPNQTPLNVPTQMTERTSFGRLQPLFASGVVPQTSADVPTNPKNTFLRHNGSTAFPPAPNTSWPTNPAETLSFPFEWMVHMDRPLVNALEATFAAAVPSHQLTQRFLDLSGLKHKHLAPWTPDLAAPLAAELHLPVTQVVDEAALYRGLELMTVKPWTYGTPNAGKVAGKINVNLVTDPRVLAALIDPHAGNFFLQTDVFNPDPKLWRDTKTVFGRLMEARRGTTPDVLAFQRAYDPATTDPAFNPGQPNTWPEIQVPGPLDTPIRSFGAALPGSLDPNVFPATTAQPNVLGVNSTPARTVPVGGVDVCIFSTLPSGNASDPLNHPYLRQEMLRKIENNLTTTTDTFVVYMTVGFFEVTNNPPYNAANRPALGKELFKDMPGDLRVKFMAVIDRTNLSIDATDPSFRTQGEGPIVTELVSLNPTTSELSIVMTGNGVVSFEGRQLTFPVGRILRIGSGASAEVVTVNSGVTYDPNTGVGRFTVTRTSTVAHSPGERVTNNVIPGNPGPQSAFNPRLPNFQAVVPYFGKIE